MMYSSFTQLRTRDLVYGRVAPNPLNLDVNMVRTSKALIKIVSKSGQMVVCLMSLKSNLWVTDEIIPYDLFGEGDTPLTRLAPPKDSIEIRRWLKQLMQIAYPTSVESSMYDLHPAKKIAKELDKCISLVEVEELMCGCWLRWLSKEDQAEALTLPAFSELISKELDLHIGIMDVNTLDGMLKAFIYVTEKNIPDPSHIFLAKSDYYLVTDLGCRKLKSRRK